MQYKKNLLFILIISSCLHMAHSWASSACPAFPYFRPTSGPLALVNCDFHTEYEKRINEMIATFGAKAGRPVILNLGGTLLFKYDGTTETVDINPDPYHDIKTFSHAVFSIELVLVKAPQGILSPQTRSALQTIKEHLEQASRDIPSLGLSSIEEEMSKRLAQMTLEFINHLLTSNSYSKNQLNHFLNETRPELKKIIKEAVLLELSALDQAVNRWLQRMTAEEQKNLAVVVATSHQARAQEISLQYFVKKFGYRLGEGAMYEKNFVVLEGKFDEPSALQLLARHYLDREAAQEILSDPFGLQHDLLADAAKEILAQSHYRDKK